MIAAATPFLIERVKEWRAASKSGADLYVQTLKEKRQASRAFSPPQTDLFKGSYTDNVLYTTGYVEVESRPEYQKKWVVGLNEFCIHDLDLNDKIVPRFVPIERNMLRTLGTMRDEINGAYAAKSIERMRETEQDAVQRMTEAIGGPKNYERFLQFKKSFYEKNR